MVGMKTLLVVRRNKMKRSIQWHKDRLRLSVGCADSCFGNACRAYEAAKQNYYNSVKKNNFRATQIDTAIQLKMDGFDENRFMKKRKVKNGDSK
jgi:hypothetical protein